MSRTILLPDGAEMAYDDRGDGRPVVLIHGVSMSRRFFDRNTGPLSERFRVIDVDLRGHGDSPLSEGGHTVAQYARDIHHMIAELGLEGAVLVGWSMGSMVVWDLIRQFGTEGLGGHVVVSQGPSDLKRDDWELGAFSLEELHGLLDAAQTDYRGVMEEFVPSMFMDGQAAADLEMLVGETQRIGPNAGTCILLNQSLQDYRDVVGSHTLPTLLAWGRDEKLIQLASGEWLAAHQPARLVVFDHSGHCPMWEEPDRFHQAVAEFVSTLG